MEGQDSGLLRAVGSLTAAAPDEKRKPMGGSMVWFNEAKDHGIILTEEGERLPVLGDGFAGGERPKGRCARALVSFELIERDGLRRADNVELVVEENPRRARRRYRPAQ